MGRIVPLGRVEEERVGAVVCDRSVKKMARLEPLTGDDVGQGPRQLSVTRIAFIISITRRSSADYYLPYLLNHHVIIVGVHNHCYGLEK